MTPEQVKVIYSTAARDYSRRSKNTLVSRKFESNEETNLKSSYSTTRSVNGFTNTEISLPSYAVTSMPNFFCTEFHCKLRFAYKILRILRSTSLMTLLSRTKKKSVTRPKKTVITITIQCEKNSSYKPCPTHEYEKKPRKSKTPRLHDLSLKFCQEFQQSQS